MIPLWLLLLPPSVSTITIDFKLGSLKGAEFISKDGSLVHAFKHVPFALPPVGHLRYAFPEPAVPWDGVRDATAYGPACMQNSSISNSSKIQTWVNEDCLHVNIFTSDRCLKSKTCAVAFYLHGGGFSYNSAVMFPDDILVENFGSKDVVLVITAFRLGFFGLLSFGNDNVIPRNLPYYDILLSLHWVQDNINHFGGDSEKVTLFGHSGGAVAAVSLAFSSNIDPERKLFHQVVAMSHPLTIGGSDELQHRSLGLEFIKRAGCMPYYSVGDPSDNFIEEVVACMRKKDALELLGIQRKMEEEGSTIIGFLLTGPLFPSSVKEVFSNAPKIPILTGATWYESDYSLQDNTANNADSLGYANPLALTEKYKRDEKEGKLAFNSSSSTQSMFLSSRQSIAAMTKAGAKCYLYSYRNWRHAKHTGDLSYIMGTHTFEPDENEAVIAKLYPQYFVNFVKTGVPDPDWEPFRPEDDNYYAIDVNVKTGLMPKNELQFENAVIDYWTKEMATYDEKVTAERTPVKPMRRTAVVPTETEESLPQEEERSSENFFLSWIYNAFIFAMVLLVGVLLGRLSSPKQIVLLYDVDERTPLFLK